jgi:hypothetical protein
VTTSLLRVIGHASVLRYYDLNQTLRMFAVGTKRTSMPAVSVSATGGKADTRLAAQPYAFMGTRPSSGTDNRVAVNNNGLMRTGTAGR